MIELIEAVEQFVSLLEDARPKFQIHRDEKLDFASRRVRMIFRKRFSAQRKSVLGGAFLKRTVQALSDRWPLKEAEGDDPTVKDYLTVQIAPLIYAELVNAKHVEVFAQSLTKAINAGAEIVSEHLSAPMPDTGSFVANYVRDNGLTKLTGEIDQTTVKRLAAAIADAYEGGEDFAGVVKAVKGEFADFSTKRLEMISSTELNNAFNKSVMQFGEEAGGTGKSWEIEPGACIVCVGNALEGVIPLGGLFASGDSEPTAHPLCGCSLMIHA